MNDYLKLGTPQNSRMHRVSWETIMALSEMFNMPRTSLTKGLAIRGSLKIPIRKEKPVPDHLYEITSEIEQIVHESFNIPEFYADPSDRDGYDAIETYGHETINEPFPANPSKRYLGRILAEDEHGVLVSIDIWGLNPAESKECSYVQFMGQFPLEDTAVMDDSDKGRYKPCTLNALRGIEKYINTITRIFVGYPRDIFSWDPRKENKAPLIAVQSLDYQLFEEANLLPKINPHLVTGNTD